MNLDPIRKYIQIQILDDAEACIGADDDLLLTQILDSLGVMRLVAHLEEIWEIQIPSEDVTLENFRTLRQIDDYLSRRTASKTITSGSARPGG